MKCLKPDCTSEEVSRGLCKRCYMTASYLVRSGKTTWSTLEAHGKVKPVTTTRRNSRWFLEGGAE